MLVLVEADFNFSLSACHIAGPSNLAADLLSRNNLSEFFLYFPQANQHPLSITVDLLSLLLDFSADWPSPH